MKKFNAFKRYSSDDASFCKKAGSCGGPLDLLSALAGGHNLPAQKTVPFTGLSAIQASGPGWQLAADARADIAKEAYRHRPPAPAF